MRQKNIITNGIMLGNVLLGRKIISVLEVSTCKRGSRPKQTHRTECDAHEHQVNCPAMCVSTVFTFSVRWYKTRKT